MLLPDSFDASASDRITFVPLQLSDVPQLYGWVKTPHVRAWWDSPDTCEAFAEQVAPLLTGQSAKRPYLIRCDERPIGYIQRFRIRQVPLYWSAYQIQEEAVGVDLYIGDEHYLHRGLGPRIVEQFVRGLVFADETVDSCIIGPEPDNHAAIRAYEKAGFAYLKTVLLPELGEHLYLMRLARDASISSV
jgi:RimJ/RimL family protein N-acetyltransferase